MFDIDTLEDSARPLLRNAAADTDTIYPIHEIRRALAAGDLTPQEFATIWRDAALQFQTRSNLVGLKLLLLLMNKASARESLIGELAFQQYSGILALIEGAFDRALFHFSEEYSLAQQLDNSDEIVLAELNLSRAYLMEFKLEQTAMFLDKAGQRLQKQPNLLLQTKLLNRQAELAAYQHLTNLSLEKAEAALELARQHAQPLEEGFALNWLGVGWMYQRDMRRAEQALLEALRVRQQGRDVLGRAESLANLSRLYLKRDELNLANSAVEGSLAILRQLRNRPGIAQSLYWKAALLQRTGQSEAALPWAKEAVELRLELGEPTKLAETFSLLGQIYTELSQPELALTCYRRVLELNQPENKTPQWIDLLVATGDFLLHRDERDLDSQTLWQEGLVAYRRAIEIIEQNDDLFYLAPVLGRMARALLKLEGVDGVVEAIRCYRLQLTLLGDIESPYFEASDAIAQRAEALNGLQICASLLRRYSKN